MTGFVLDASVTKEWLLAEVRELLTEAHSEAFLKMLSSHPIRADGSTSARALTDTLHLARRHGLSSYAASYLELAVRTGLPIATLGADLAKAARRAGVKPYAA